MLRYKLTVLFYLFTSKKISSVQISIKHLINLAHMNESTNQRITKKLYIKKK